MVAARLISAADLAALPDDERGELIDGVLLPMTPVKKAHWRVSAKLTRLLGDFAEAANLGIVGPERGYLLRTNPDTVLAPDVSFVARERDIDDDDIIGFPLLTPDLAVEVRSPGDSSAELSRKVEIYLSAGCPLVWEIDPAAKTVLVHSPDREPITLGLDGMLDAEPVLPGFSVAVAALFT